MTTLHKVASALRLAGFILLVAAIAPTFQGDPLRVELLILAMVLIAVGVVTGLNERRRNPPPTR